MEKCFLCKRSIGFEGGRGLCGKHYQILVKHERPPKKIVYVEKEVLIKNINPKLVRNSRQLLEMVYRRIQSLRRQIKKEYQTFEAPIASVDDYITKRAGRIGLDEYYQIADILINRAKLDDRLAKFQRLTSELTDDTI